MEIRIGRTAHQCALTQEPFEDGEELVSLIRQGEHEIVRLDYARRNWSRDHGAGALAVWTHRYRDPKREEAAEREKLSPLRQAFYEALERGTREELAVAYMAAQLLRRQRVFRLVKDSDDADGEVRVALFTDRMNDRLIEVYDPALTYAEMEAGSRLLMARLAELENPGEDPGDAAEPAAAEPEPDGTDH